jgi:hypothetical protein
LTRGHKADAVNRIANDIIDRAEKIEADREKVFHGLHPAAFPAAG